MWFFCYNATSFTFHCKSLEISSWNPKILFESSLVFSDVKFCFYATSANCFVLKALKLCCNCPISLCGSLKILCCTPMIQVLFFVVSVINYYVNVQRICVDSLWCFWVRRFWFVKLQKFYSAFFSDRLGWLFLIFHCDTYCSSFVSLVT
jgi:hypothetical protein